jgi:hypothetical protein
MNTITISDGESQNGAMITYTDHEIVRMIAELKDYKDRQERLGDANVNLNKDIRTLREKVRDFFSEVEWQDGEQTVSKSDVNELLESIGTNRLTSTYGGSFTITGTFQVEAENEDDAESKFTEGVDVNFNEGDITVDDVRAEDIAEDY